MKTTLSTLFAIFLVIAAGAQWSTNPSVNNPINTMSGEQAIPKIATCSNNYSYIASFSNESGNYNVRMQLLDPQGNPQWASNGILISSHPQMTWLTDWDMAADNANHAVLVFQDIRNGGNNNVVAYRIAPDGSFSWGADGIALSNSTAFDAAPKVVTTSTGNAVVAWQADDVIILQKIDPAGNLLWGASGITLSCADTYSWPQLLPVGTDEVILKYFHDTGPSYSPTRHVYAQRYDANGSPVWASPAVISNAGGISAWTQIFPFINDGSDGFYMTWHDDRNNDMNASVFVQHISSTGTVLFPANGVEVASQANRERMYPDLALPPGTTDIYVFWNEMDADQNQRGIYGQKMSSSGTILWPANGMIFIDLSPLNVYPVAARHSPTDVVVFYEEYFNAVDAQIKAMRIDASGALLWTPGMITLCSVNSEKVHTVTNDFGNNQWIVSWEDDRSGNKDIYAQNIQLDGTLGPYVPQNGFIEGQVTLIGGTGDVTQVIVTAGTETVHPDASGHYSMEILFGTYDVYASLPGYYPDTVNGVNVTVGQVTPDVDFTLNALPTGFIQGNVSLNGGPGDVTQVEVTAGITMVHPDASGNYQMEVWTGTYDVIAKLSGYLPDTVQDVTVLDGQTSTGVDLVLDIIPFKGFIEGVVELQNGAGDVTLVDVTADTVTVHPDATGYYIMEVAAGTYDVSASLAGFLTQYQTGVQVDTGAVTSDVDFFLYLAPNTGYIEGYITLINGAGDVTQTEVRAGGHMDHPSSDGFYHIALDAGTYTVTASHPYTLTDSITGVEVQAGSTTGDVNFDLQVIRADLICKAYDLEGNILNNVNLEIHGPQDTCSGTIMNDSIVFTDLPYGYYEGVADYPGQDPVFAAEYLDGSNHYLIFFIDITGLSPESIISSGNIYVFPNPFTGNVNIRLNGGYTGQVSIKIIDMQGKEIRLLCDGTVSSGSRILKWDGNDDRGNPVDRGIYMVVFQDGHQVSSCKIIKRD